MAHMYNPTIWEVEAGRLCNQGQSELYSKILFHKTKSQKCSLVVEHSSRMYKTLGLTLSTDSLSYLLPPSAEIGMNLDVR